MSSKPSSSSSRTPTKRILTELSAFNTTYPSTSPHPSILTLQPSPNNLLLLHAILTPPISPYSSTRFLLSITLPPSYPNTPPTITFLTKICHPNISFTTGEICLDILKENWTPVLGVVGALESIVRLLGEPGVDSPLNVEVAALMRGGDLVGARGLVSYYCAEEGFRGSIEEGVVRDG